MMQRNWRAVGLVVFMIGVLFKLQHWPMANLFLLLSWCFFFVAMIVLLVAPIANDQVALFREVFFFGVVSSFMFNVLHWPGRLVAFILMAIGGIGWLISSRHGHGPTDAGEQTYKWVLVVAIALSIAGALGLVWNGALIIALLFWGWWFLVSMKDRSQ